MTDHSGYCDREFNSEAYIYTWGKDFVFSSGKSHQVSSRGCESVTGGADAVVVHVGTNVIMMGSSEQLKMDFKELIRSLLDTNKCPITSGPVPSLNHGIEHFIRLLVLARRLLQLCGCNIY